MCGLVTGLGSCGDGEPEGEIRFTRNFASEINAEIEKIPLEDRAWPGYEAAMAALEPLPDVWWDDEDFDWPAEPGGARWDDVVAYLDRNAEAVRLAHRASLKPRIGAPLSGLEVEDPVAWRIGSRSGGPGQRELHRLLYTASRRAVWEGDADGAAMTLETMLGMAGHVGESADGLQFSVALALQASAVEALLLAMHDRPDLLESEWLKKTAAKLRAPDERRWAEGVLDRERLVFLDYLQRAFTDDGAGDGELSPRVHDAIIGEFVYGREVDQLEPTEYPEAGANLRGTSRASMREAAEQYRALVRARLQQAPWLAFQSDAEMPDVTESQFAVLDRFSAVPGILMVATHLNRARSRPRRW